MRRMVRLYRRNLGAHLRSHLEYEADFWIVAVSAIFYQTFGIFLLGAVFARVPTLNGWRFEEVVLIYGLTGFTGAFLPLVADGVWQLGGLIHGGELDYRLVRPYPPVLQVMSGQCGINGMGDIVGSGALLIWALTRVEIHWTVGTVAMTALLMASAIVLRAAIALAANSAQFWLRSPHPSLAITVHAVGELSRYPITIYGSALRLLVSVGVPYAFASFFPAAWLLGKGGYGWLGLMTPLVAVCFAALAYGIFQLGLRRYDSTGH
jgi:ABC-2 type transport system permease protein